MDFSREERYSPRRLVGIGVVLLLHLGLVYALMTGSARRVVEVIVRPIETKIIEEHRPLPPEEPLPPPPKIDMPPPPYIPPPEVQIQPPPQQSTAIAAVTNVKPAGPAAPFARGGDGSPPDIRQPVHSPPVIDAARNCKKPQYPPASERLHETGTVVLQFLIDTDGRVLSSHVQASSGHPRLDDAARDGLSLCQFKPGMVDGKPEQAWATLRYTWELEE